MRIAIFHDYFSFIGGGERLVLILARHLGADIITTNVERSLVEKMGFGDVHIISLGRLTGIEPLKQIQATWKFTTCDFRGKYDFYIFSGNWAHHASLRHHPNLYYCHAHVRVFYDLKEQTLAALQNPLEKALAHAWIYLHSFFDRLSIARVDRIVANSGDIARRIKKYLQRDSTIVYPPVDVSKFNDGGDGGYWLSVNRLFPEKRIELQIAAFSRMPDQRLVIIGNKDAGQYSDAYAKSIRASLPPNVELISGIGEASLIEYYGHCRGFISTSRDEPFGMAAVEAMASGKPVIAVDGGGFRETILDGMTGRLIRGCATDLVAAVDEIGYQAASFREACVRQAKKFDVSVFFKGMDALIGNPASLKTPDEDKDPATPPVKAILRH